MKVYLSPIVNVKRQKIKFNRESIQVSVDGINYLYDFSNLPVGQMANSTEHIINAKRDNGELSVNIVNYIGVEASEEEKFPQWQTVERTDELDPNAQIVPIEWITKEELEVIENAPKPPTVDDRIEQLESRLLSPSEVYERLDKTTIQLEQLKHYKLNQLNELCNKAIVQGFVYFIENKEYLFSASVEAQGNFQGTDALFKEGLIQEVYWSVTNTSTNIVERVRLDNDLFNQVKVQLFNHINTQISKFRDFLQPLVLEASTNLEVDNINW